VPFNLNNAKTKQLLTFLEIDKLGKITWENELAEELAPPFKVPGPESLCDDKRKKSVQITFIERLLFLRWHTISLPLNFFFFFCFYNYILILQ